LIVDKISGNPIGNDDSVNEGIFDGAELCTFDGDVLGKDDGLIVGRLNDSTLGNEDGVNEESSNGI